MRYNPVFLRTLFWKDVFACSAFLSARTVSDADIAEAQGGDPAVDAGYPALWSAEAAEGIVRVDNV